MFTVRAAKVFLARSSISLRSGCWDSDELAGTAEHHGGLAAEVVGQMHLQSVTPHPVRQVAELAQVPPAVEIGADRWLSIRVSGESLRLSGDRRFERLQLLGAFAAGEPVLRIGA